MVPLKYSNDTAPYKKLNFFPPFLVLGVGHPSVTCSWHVLWRTGQQFYRDAGGKKKRHGKCSYFLWPVLPSSSITLKEGHTAPVQQV